MKPSFPSRVEHRQGRGQGHSVACVRVKGARFEVPERIRGQEAGSMISEAHVTSGPQRCSGLCDVLSLGMPNGSQEAHQPSQSLLRDAC